MTLNSSNTSLHQYIKWGLYVLTDINACPVFSDELYDLSKSNQWTATKVEKKKNYVRIVCQVVIFDIEGDLW